jgi:hypothetical protein
VTGSQHLPSAQPFATHVWTGTHIGVMESSHTSPIAQGGHVGTHMPSLQISPVWQLTPAQDSTQVDIVKSPLGLQTSSGMQGLGSQGLSTHEPRLQTVSQPWQGRL